MARGWHATVRRGGHGESGNGMCTPRRRDASSSGVVLVVWGQPHARRARDRVDGKRRVRLMLRMRGECTRREVPMIMLVAHAVQWGGASASSPSHASAQRTRSRSGRDHFM